MVRQKKFVGKSSVNCPGCGKMLDPTRHGELVCDGEVYCEGCHRYARELLLPRPFEEIAAWNRSICEAWGWEPPTLTQGDLPPVGPFDFLADLKLLMAEADHRARSILFYPPGLRLATLCHELAHLMTGQDHTEAWARTFAELVAWVKARLPEDLSTQGFYVNLLNR
jgi:hypothetical protein